MRRYTNPVPVRMTPDENSRLKERANQAGLSLSRYLVECGLITGPSTYEDREQRERALMEIRRVGNNLNQVARRLNGRTGTINSQGVEQVLAELSDALQQLRALLPDRSAK